MTNIYKGYMEEAITIKTHLFLYFPEVYTNNNITFLTTCKRLQIYIIVYQQGKSRQLSDLRLVVRGDNRSR